MSRSQIDQRAPKKFEGLKSALAVRRWRQKNRDRLADDANLTGPLATVADDLVRDGIAIARFEDVFGTRDLLDQALSAAEQLPGRHDHTRNMGGEKDFKSDLLSEVLHIDDVWTRIAVHQNVLEVAKRYLGMRSLLRAADVWLTFPTPGPAASTQLWHKDDDDLMNVKLFVYLTEVTNESGAFCFAPRTHPRSTAKAVDGVSGRVEDEAFAKLVPEEDWVVCTGPVGTVVFADTCGWHKQLKPVTGERLLFMSQYTSGTPNWEPATAIEAPDLGELTIDQRFAVLRNP